MEHSLFQVHAASVNPLDTQMVEGYGSAFLPLLKTVSNLSSCQSTRQANLPLVLGRDFSGKIVSKGQKVSRLQAGDEVSQTVFFF